MRIALVAPLYEAVPPVLYGGTERVVSFLSEALVGLGHHVTLFASGDTQTSAELVAVRDRAIRLDPVTLKSDMAAHLTMLHEVRRRAQEFDLLHFHIDLLHFPMFENKAEHTLTTLHGRLDLNDLPGIYRRWSAFPLVSISHAQRRPMPWAHWVSTIHHGVPIDRFTFSAQAAAPSYVAFVGRISPEKRPDRAIRIAEQARIPLKIAAKVDAVDAEYFHERIARMIEAPQTEFIGEVADGDKDALLGGALALLFPIDWPEPFGLVMIEAMACGTPVIAWDSGSVREVVDDGVTGFVVNSIGGAVDALHRVETLDRRRIRRVFEERFCATTMARNYCATYRRLIDRRARRPALLAS